MCVYVCTYNANINITINICLSRSSPDVLPVRARRSRTDGYAPHNIYIYIYIERERCAHYMYCM